MYDLCFFTSSDFFFQPVSRPVPQGLQQILLDAEFIVVDVSLEFGLLNFV